MHGVPQSQLLLHILPEEGESLGVSCWFGCCRVRDTGDSQGLCPGPGTGCATWAGKAQASAAWAQSRG